MTRDDEPIMATAEDPGFAMVPYWVLMNASGNAVKLYAILRKYANNDTHIAYPSRKRLADDMGFKDPKSLTPLIKELEDLGAIQVQRRRLEHFVNYYKVFHRQPARSARTAREPQPVVVVGEDSPPPPAAQVGENLPEGRGESSPEVGEKTPHELDPLTRPTELEGVGASANANQELALPGVPPKAELEKAQPRPEQQIAQWAYDKTRGGLKYQAMMALGKAAVALNYPPGEVAKAMVEMYRRNPQGTVTHSGLIKFLQTNGNPTAARPSTTNQRVGAALSRAEQYEKSGRV